MHISDPLPYLSDAESVYIIEETARSVKDGKNV